MPFNKLLQTNHTNMNKEHCVAHLTGILKTVYLGQVIVKPVSVQTYYTYSHLVWVIAAAIYVGPQILDCRVQTARLHGSSHC